MIVIIIGVLFPKTSGSHVSPSQERGDSIPTHHIYRLQLLQDAVLKCKACGQRAHVMCRSLLMGLMQVNNVATLSECRPLTVFGRLEAALYYGYANKHSSRTLSGVAQIRWNIQPPIIIAKTSKHAVVSHRRGCDHETRYILLQVVILWNTAHACPLDVLPAVCCT